MPRSFDWQDFTPAAVAASKRNRTVSVCIPARDEESTISPIVEAISSELMGSHQVVDELIVIDDGSKDSTAQAASAAGASVISSKELEHLAHMPDGHSHGKGEAMWRGLACSSGDILAYCDADILNFDPRLVLGIIGPLLADNTISLVKGSYSRPLNGQPGEGGRVTELTARPLISVLFPALSFIDQPLGGEWGGRRDALEAVPYISGYGVELGMLIDISEKFGPESIAQCRLGERAHRNRSLAELGPQAMAVTQVALSRAGLAGPLPWACELIRPGAAPQEVRLDECPPISSLTTRSCSEDRPL